MAEATEILCPICHQPNPRRAKFCKHCGRDVVLNNDGPRYYITRIIKEGGQGAVYQAIDDSDRVYAVKEMLDRFTDPKERAEAVERFEAEARLLKQLSHPRIPKIYATFKDEGRSYLVMDFVRGEDLEQLLQREGSMPEARALELAEQLTDVLGYLHRKNFIYRDMKPSNIMIDAQTGGVKLVDFGIAKVFEPTNRGTQIGTPGYAPPEQYQGLASPASDIYALGASLHHMLTGRDPRDEKPFSFPPVRSLVPAISRRTETALAKALQMKVDDRYSSVPEFWADLRPLPAPSQVRVAPATTVLPAQPNVATAPPPVAAPPPSRPAAPPRATPPIGLPAQTSVTAPPAAPAQPGFVSRFFRWVGRMLARAATLLIILAVIGGLLIWQAPDLVAPYAGVINRYVPGLIQPTPVTMITQTFSTGQMEVVVAPGQDVRAAFVAAYTSVARQQLGDATQVNTATLSYLGGEPQKIGDEANGTRYRGAMTGFVSAPQR